MSTQTGARPASRLAHYRSAHRSITADASDCTSEYSSGHASVNPGPARRVPSLNKHGEAPPWQSAAWSPRSSGRATCTPGEAAIDGSPPLVSVVVPAYNEAIDIAATGRSLAYSNYPEVEIIVVDDGSTDDTAAIVEGPRPPKPDGDPPSKHRKAGALNPGLLHASHQIVVTVDGATVFKPELRKLTQINQAQSKRLRGLARF